MADPHLLARLRGDLLAADFTAEAIRVRLGEDADEARARGVLPPARRALVAAAGTPSPALDVLIELFLLAGSLPRDTVTAALPTLGYDGAHELGLLSDSGVGQARAAVSLNATRLPGSERHWWLLSDLDEHFVGGPLRPDHVLGVGGATRSLLGIAFPTSPGDRVLDLGTGCGVIGLVAAEAGASVVATDVSARALTFAEMNARLNEQSGIEFRLGDRFEPVRGERFDQILSNPPFVITPRVAGVARYEYRDGGLAGDDLVASVLGSAEAHLNPGGTLQALANWEYRWGQDGLQRVLGWVSGAEAHEPHQWLDAWVLERQRLSPVRYAETWARDGGAVAGSAEFDARVNDWLADFSSRRVHGIGFGFVFLHAGAGDRPPVRRSEIASGPLPEPGEERLGAHLERAFAAGRAQDALGDDDYADLYLSVVSEVTEQRDYVPGAEEPSAIRLVQADGLGRVIGLDTVLAAAIGASDGELSVGQISDALAGLLNADGVELRAALVAGLRELVWHGVLAPNPAPGPR